ncbi:MAG: DUF4974 domain-containing protein [Prevotella sp.]|nr:DUF4974 domain-containing protein [Prevotella sp.]
MNNYKILLEKYMQGIINEEELAELRRLTNDMNDFQLRDVLEELWLEDKGSATMDDAKKQELFSEISRHIQPSTAEEDKTTSRTISIKRILRIAAVFLCFIAGAAIWMNNNRVEKPQLAPEILAVIEQAEKSGKNQAVLSTNGRQVSVTSEEGITKAQKGGAPQGKTTINGNTITTYHDSEFWMTLEDGTRVHLNYGTQLRYPIHFSSETREVELTGEAYFFVAKDKNRPFIVHTPNGDVKQYGTEFNINTKDEIGVTRIVLVNGSIGVTAKGGKEFMMKPNDMAILQPGETEPMVSQVDITPYIAWNIGTFVFEDCTLEQLMRVLSHWYNKRVQFESEEIRQMRFTGEFDKYESIIPTMKAIHNVTGLRIEVHGKDIIISE